MLYDTVMILPPTKFQRAMCLLALMLLTGCASQAARIDPLGYANASCADLNVAIGDTSKAISSAAISRGRIDRVSIPFWVPGGEKAVSVLKDRRTRKIDQLQGQLEAMRSARQARCT